MKRDVPGSDTDPAPDAAPERVHALPELKTALSVLRGSRTYADLNKTLNPERSPSGPRLAPSTLSGLFNGSSVPSRQTFELFLIACGLDKPARKPWQDAWARVATGHSPCPPGAVRVNDAGARQLGVHASIQVDPTATDLPTYVPRDLDLELRTHLAAARNQPGGFVLLVGGSSVGKTRALVEAVQAVLGEWWLVHPDPAEPHTLANLATALPLRTVVWLDELQRYLTAPGGLPAGRVRALIAAGAVLVGTLWPKEYGPRVAPPPHPGHPDPYENDRHLLRLARIIGVADELSDAEQSRAHALADGDQRIRTALAAPDAGFTQVLAAGPELVRWWDNASDPYGKATITAALDARRIGAAAPLTRQVLEAAAPAYLTPAQRATAPPDWFDRALEYATTLLHGAAATLSPVPAGMGHIAGYTAADYLHQHARRTCRTRAVPDQVWQALTDHHAHDHLSLADNAHRRGQDRYVEGFYRRGADAGDQAAASHLATLLARHGDIDELRQQADNGNRDAAYELAVMLVQQGRVDELRRRVDDGDDIAADRLAELLAEQGRVDELRRCADDGNPVAAIHLARLLAEQGNLDELRRRADDGGPEAAIWLAELLTDRGRVDELRRRADEGETEAANRLVELLTEQGRIDDAICVLRRQADAGEHDAAIQLTGLLVEQGRIDDAIVIVRRLVDEGDQDAAYRLATLLARHGDIDELRQQADNGNRDAAYELAVMLVQQGRVDELRRRVDDGDDIAADRLAELLAEQGRVDELRRCADDGNPGAAYRLADLLAKQGRVKEAMSLLRERAGADDEGAAIRLAELLAKHGNTEEAMTVFRSLAAVDSRGYAADRLLWFLAQQGQIDELRERAESRPFAAQILIETLALQGQIGELEDEVRAGTPGAIELLGTLRGAAAPSSAACFSRYWKTINT